MSALEQDLDQVPEPGAVPTCHGPVDGAHTCSSCDCDTHREGVASMTAPTVDPTTGEITPAGFDDDTIEQARCDLGEALTFLATETAALNDDTDVPDLARALCVLRDLKQDASTIYADVEQQLLALMGDRRVEVPGLGVFEAHRRTKRTGWDHDALIGDVIEAVHRDDPDVPPGPFEVAAALRECISFGAGKVTGMKARGLTPDEYCQVEENGYSIQLPPRDHGKDVA